MKNVLLTGGAGYIGSHVLEILDTLNYKVTVIDNLSTGKASNVRSAALHKINLEDLNSVEQVLKEGSFDACIHFAASIDAEESVQQPSKYFNNNTLNTNRLIELCVKYNVHNFIFSSTAAVYGDTETGLCSESTPTLPINPYGQSKLASEWFLENQANINSKLNYIALRYFNVAGASSSNKIGHGKNAKHLIKVLAQAALDNKEFTIFGDDYNTPDGTCIRDFIHISDLAQAHIDALEYLFNNPSSHVLNCGYGHGYSVKEAIECMEKVSQKKIRHIAGKRREGDIVRSCAEASKIKELLKWQPKYDQLELICNSTLEWEKKSRENND